MTANISREDAQHVLWHLGHPEGKQPDEFRERLVAAAMKADPAELDQLRAAFPGLAQAAMIVDKAWGGVDLLVGVANASTVETMSGPRYSPVLSFAVLGEPVPKGRPRSAPGQQAYTPKRTRDAEMKIRSAFQALHPGFVPLTGRLAFRAEFHRETARYADTDNLLKLCTDALNRVAFRDDEQIEVVHGERFYRAGDQARTVITISQRIEELPELFGDTEEGMR